MRWEITTEPIDPKVGDIVETRLRYGLGIPIGTHAKVVVIYVNGHVRCELLESAAIGWRFDAATEELEWVQPL